MTTMETEQAIGAPLRVTVYDGASRDRIAVSAWGRMFAELWRYRELTRRLLGRNIAGQFRQSFLGYVWIALPPVATTLIFTMLRRAQVVNVPMEGHVLPYALFALIGTTLWGFFSQLTIMATMSIANAGVLVTRVYFPREVLVLSAIGNAVVNFGIRLVVVVLSFALLGFHPPWQVVFFPLLLVPMLAFGVGLGFILAPINTMMRDMGRVLEFAFQFGMFLAPTIYPTPDIARDIGRWKVALYWLHNLNPVSHFIQAVDTLVETGSFVPDNGFVAACGISFLVLLIGWRFFHICEPLLAERL